jgi:hypothetical protein
MGRRVLPSQSSLSSRQFIPQAVRYRAPLPEGFESAPLSFFPDIDLVELAEIQIALSVAR